MPQQSLNYNSTATCEYLRVIRQHVIHPLDMTPVADSCFAAALLVFSSIDGLGKLIHSDANAGPGERFKEFLSWLGPEYSVLEEELWRLRNTLAHSAMNVACFMSKTDDARGEHLEQDHGFAFVHTGRLLEDFKSAIDKLEAKFQTDATLLQRAESRLVWDYIDEPGWRGGGVKPTPPPGIRFVRER
jgi:hypothetical protein